MCDGDDDISCLMVMIMIFLCHGGEVLAFENVMIFLSVWGFGK